MSIFITKSLPIGETRVDSFVTRGLSGQTSSSVRDAQIVIYGKKNVGTAIDFAFYHAKIKSSIDHSLTYGEWDLPNDYLRQCKVEVAEFPKMLIKAKGVTQNELMLMGFVSTEKKDIYMGRPSLENYVKLANRNVDENQFATFGCTNMVGYGAFLWGRRAIRAFVQCGGGMQRSATVMVRSDEIERQIRSVLEEGMALDKIDDVMVLLKDKCRFMKPVIAQDLIARDGSDTTLSMQNEEWALQVSAFDKDKAGPGFVFPYFPEMMDGDKDYVYDIFSRIFVKACCAAEENIVELLGTVRRGFRYIAYTQEGKQLQHQFMAIDFASQCNGRVIYLKDGSNYIGFILQTSDTTIYERGIKHLPLPVKDLVHEVNLLRKHEAAIDGIIALLSVHRNMAGNEPDINKELAMTKPRYLHAVIRTFAADSISDLKESLEGYIKDLTYSQVFWECTSSTLLDFIRLLSSSDISVDLPFFTSPSTMLSRNHILECMAVFGAQGPSIFHGDTRKNIMRPGTDDPNTQVIEKRKVLPYVPFYKKGIHQAAADWTNTKNSKAIKFVGAKKNQEGTFANRSKDSGVVGEPERPTFYELLREWVWTGEGSSTREVDKGKKRARQDDDDEEDIRPKAKKVYI